MNTRLSALWKDLADLAESSPRAKLPPFRALASRWGVSTASVQIAVGQAVDQGWLETRPGSGVWPKGARPIPKDAPPRMDAHRLAERLRQQVEEGTFATGDPMPAPKGTAVVQGVHPATVRKAYEALRSEGLLVRDGRSWKVRDLLEKHTRRPVVLCIGAAGQDGRLRMESDREWDFWREIQIEATRCGLEPVLVAAGEQVPEFDPGAFGAIVSNWHMGETSPLLDGLLRLRLPTAVWVANEESLPGKRYQGTRGMWFHDLAQGRGAGEAMARYVEGLGHRKIAWISPFHGSSWSRNRLNALASALPPSIEVFEAVHGWISEWDVQVEVAWNPEVTRRLDLDGIDGQADPDDLRRPLVETLTRMRCLEVFAPCLERALESGATLWVAGSDLIAKWCLQWLRSRSLETPRDIALASFDDTREATQLDLTSLRFDVQGMARAMIRQVLSSRKEHKRLTRYTGSVVTRASTSGGTDERIAVRSSRRSSIPN